MPLLDPAPPLPPLPPPSSLALPPPALELPPPPSPGGGESTVGMLSDSWGWSFVVGLALLTVIYCVTGCVRRCSHGHSGLGAMPHPDFWRSLPELVADGVRFAMGKDRPPRERRTSRAVAGISGHDDEYYSAGRRDSADYIPAGGSVPLPLSPPNPVRSAARLSAHSLAPARQRREPGDYTSRGSRSQAAAARADRTGSGRRLSSGAPPPPNWPAEGDRKPAAGGGGEEEDEWRNRKTRDTRREEREERERRSALPPSFAPLAALLLSLARLGLARVKAWVDSGGTDAHWMLAAEREDDVENVRRPMPAGDE